MPRNEYPDFPKIDADLDLDAADIHRLRQATAGKQRHGIYNTFQVEGVNRWGRPEVHRLSRIVVSRQPHEGIPAELAVVRLSGGRDVYVAFESDNDRTFGALLCSANARPWTAHGVIVQDPTGQPWLCGRASKDTEAPLTGDEYLRRLHPIASPFLKAFGLQGATSLADRLPAHGQFLINHDDTLLGPVSSWDRPGSDMKDVVRKIEGRITAILDREDRIRALAERHFPKGCFDGLASGPDAPLAGGAVPGYMSEKAEPFQARIGEMTRGLMEDLRSEGLLAPCPNNTGRDVASMSAWNMWLDGKLDDSASADAFGDGMAEMHLFDAPGFSVARDILIRSLISFEMEREKTSPDELPPATDAEVLAVIEAARKKIIEIYAGERLHHEMSIPDLRNSVTGERHRIGETFLKPVLCGFPEAMYQPPVPLPVLETPKSVRHMELSLPSGVLVMADWFRIEGFQKGLEALIGEDNYGLNEADGLDARARDYFEKAGLAIVQVGNTSPSAWRDGPGVWRMGRVDEDHERFWTESGEPNPDIETPKREWKTCTDLWANTFADREVITDILMASGEYPDRQAAAVALTDYCKNEYGVSMVDLGVDQLHLYVPTGYGVHREDFNEVFRAAEIEPAEWREDQYILSAQPLTVDPEILAPCDWTEKPVEISAPSDDAPSP